MSPTMEDDTEANPFKTSETAPSSFLGGRMMTKVKSQWDLDGDMVNLIKEGRE